MLDILGLPLDEFLVPAEAVLDIGLLAVAVLSGLGRGRGSGRKVGGGSGGGGTARLRRGHRGVAHVPFLGVAIFWAAFFALIIFQAWWSAQNPLLALLFGIFIAGFDVLVLLLGFVLTIAALWGRHQNSGPQIGGGYA